MAAAPARTWLLALLFLGCLAALVSVQRGLDSDSLGTRLRPDDSAERGPRPPQQPEQAPRQQQDQEQQEQPPLPRQALPPEQQEQPSTPPRSPSSSEAKGTAALRADGTSAATGASTAGAGGKARLLVMTSLYRSNLWHFMTMLWPSWRRLRDFGEAGPGQDVCGEAASGDEAMEPAQLGPADLFLACEADVCELLVRAGLPCVGWRDALARGALTGPGARCVYAEYVARPAIQYRFMHSLLFLDDEPLRAVLAARAHHWALRTDADAVLLPGLLRFLPRGAGVVGRGFSGTDFTFAYLERYARDRLGLADAPPFALRNLQSTFLVRADKLLRFARRLINATEWLYADAFSDQLCEGLKATALPAALKALLPDDRQTSARSLCRWPYWYREVASLYGTLVAAEAELRGPVGGVATDKLDLYATNSVAGINSRHSNAETVMQAHLCESKGPVSRAGERASERARERERLLRKPRGDRLGGLFDSGRRLTNARFVLARFETYRSRRS
jgi:hypothetical protein